MKKLIAIICLSCIFSTFVMPVKGFADKIVVIDPGHGGKFAGTCGYSGRETGYCEKDANLDVAIKLQNILMENGFEVKLTRHSDKEFGEFLRDEEGKNEDGDFHNRMKLANEFVMENNEQAVFISIHHNASATNPFIRGIETYYYDGVNHYKSAYPHDPLQLVYLQENKRLAETVQQYLVDELKLPNRKVHNDQSFYVIRNAQMPSILVELGYMINRNEEKLIKTAEYQERAAAAIAEAIETYFDVFEVYNSTNHKLATFLNEEDALTYANQSKSAVIVFDKYQQKVIYDQREKELKHYTQPY
ncbi:N-acetylmuramoyl-L-alanine amidase family protein [Bacillus sp. PS06]|uniref:N-acetylmuramoyl-L-alanine amidase family protein n=1 Tax=Bacillus sp. PS06 TaxID=2764176 RepID=UPI00177E1571|nr:N-acetylmuramoyl-L-alanine amidase [Bacillus sp. PS06]MBD8070563.1 N-acetylmuramoyl-L-alanine amidase [Bacillus sp. PS06]